MRVHVVDPSAYTPPYDHALCQALASAGAQVELITSRFSYGTVPAAENYDRRESFYRLGHAGPQSAAPRPAWQRALKLAEHVPEMVAYGRRAQRADVVHLQWLTVQPLDVHLLPRGGPPLVLTAHDVLPREPRPGQLRAQRALYERVDAVVVHSEHGRRRLIEELKLDPARITQIPHGVLRPWEDHVELDSGQRGQRRGLPRELATLQGPVILFLGLLRPYKGLDVLLRAWQGIEGAELWIVGMPRMDTTALKASAPPGVRFIERFLTDGELWPFLDRAYLTVLPYREIDQSGVLFTALGAGVPSVLSDVGGFPEVAATGAATLFPAGDADALRAALERLLDDPEARATMAAAARRAAETDYAWPGIAARTLDLYRTLGAR